MSARIGESHAGGVIRVTQQPGAWGAVPHAILEDSRLGLDARAVAAWLATRPDGWQILPSYLQKTLGVGRDKWRRIATELESAGYLKRNLSPSGPRNQWVWKIEFFAVPTQFSIDGFSGDGTSGDGASGDGRGGDSNKKEKNKKEKEKEEKREGARRARPVGAGPHARRSVNRGEFQLDEKTGLHYRPGDQRDEAALSQITKKFSDQEIEQARAKAAEIDDAGRAFPSRVMRILKSSPLSNHSRHHGINETNFREGVSDDGRF